MTFLDYLWNDCASNLSSYLTRQRWFGGKGRPMGAIRLADAIWLRSPPNGLALTILEVQYADGPPEFYSLIVGLLLGDRTIPVPAAAVILPRLTTLAGPASLYDALADPAACAFLLELFKLKQPLPGRFGQVAVQTTPVLGQLRGTEPLTVVPSGADQSNRSLVFRSGDEGRLMLKLFSRLEAGVNPDFEIPWVLTEETSYNSMAPLGGAISYHIYGQETTLAVLFGYEQNEGSAWEAAQRQLQQLVANIPDAVTDPTEDDLAPLVEATLPWAEKLGQRTAELHRALASVRGEAAFGTEPFTAEDLAEVAAPMSGQAVVVAAVWSQPKAQTRVRERLGLLTAQSNLGKKCRGHGDYHLGQVLTRGDDFILIDFEGEPSRPVSQRRRKASPLRDVAGMVRSLDYAASQFLHLTPSAQRERLAPWVRGWQAVATQAFLLGYYSTIEGTELLPPDEAAADALLWLFSVEKALYEVRYEQAHRPDWVEIPLSGLKALLGVT